MIVVATQIDPPHTWRKPGTTFAVQDVYAGGDRPVAFRIEAPDGNPALVDAEHFDVVDGAVSTSWEFQQGAHGTYTVGPKAWGKLGFWERWMNRDPEALASYEQFRTILVDPNLDWDVRQLELSRAN